MWTQFPDLTEFQSVYDVDARSGVNTCKTEFAFVLLAFADKTQLDSIREYGLRPVSRMNNWWPTHCGETRALTLCWGRVPNPSQSAPLAKRYRWHYGDEGEYRSIELHLAGSGCGLKIGELPLQKKQFHRYFTLMRLPVTTTPAQERWLKANHYRFLDKGALASYWVNGWPVDEWAAAKEYAYFKTTKAEWAEEGTPKQVVPKLVP